MERKQLENPDLRAGHILTLQQSLTAANATVARLRTQLSHRSEGDTVGGTEGNATVIQGYGDLQRNIYRDQTAQAQRVEQLLMNAIINMAKS